MRSMTSGRDNTCRRRRVIYGMSVWNCLWKLGNDWLDWTKIRRSCWNFTNRRQRETLHLGLTRRIRMRMGLRTDDQRISHRLHNFWPLLYTHNTHCPVSMIQKVKRNHTSLQKLVGKYSRSISCLPCPWDDSAVLEAGAANVVLDADSSVVPHLFREPLGLVHLVCCYRRVLNVLHGFSSQYTNTCRR